MHDATTLVLGHDDVSLCNMFAVVDMHTLIIFSVASDICEERDNIKLSIFGAGLVCCGVFFFSSY